MFSDLVETTSLLVYPFSGNRMRQLRYLWRSRQLGRNYSLMGLPYRMSHVVRLLLSGNGRDRLLVEGEIDGFQRHADELLACGIKTLYTTDESEAAAGRLHRALIDEGVRCINRGHGVAVYGPYVRYSHFSFYDRLQHLHYAQLGKFDSFDMKAGRNDRDAPPSRPGDIYSPVIVAIQGNWCPAEKHYEEQFEEQAYRSAGSVCRELNLPIFLKIHPDIDARTRRRLVSQFEFPYIDRLDELKGQQPIFFNTASSAYRAFLYDGPTVFPMDPFQQPRMLFGEQAHGVTPDHLSEELVRLRDADYWFRLLSAQIKRETNPDE